MVFETLVLDKFVLYIRLAINVSFILILGKTLHHVAIIYVTLFKKPMHMIFTQMYEGLHSLYV